MKYWTIEEMHEVEEELTSRKWTAENLPDKLLKNLSWAYEEWEDELIECFAESGYAISAVSKFLRRNDGDVLHHVRELGYTNWKAFCESVQCATGEDVKKTYSANYRDMVSSALGRPLTKEECIHHINCDHQDDVLNNLWICNRANHRHAHASYRNIQKALIAYGVISFNRNTGDYEFDADAVENFVKHWPDDSLTTPDLGSR